MNIHITATSVRPRAESFTCGREALHARSNHRDELTKSREMRDSKSANNSWQFIPCWLSIDD